MPTDGNELQVDLGSAQHVNSPKHLISAFQTADRIAASIKNKNRAIFDIVNVRKYFCEIDGYRYPKDAVRKIFPENDHLDLYRDHNLFYKEYVGDELLNPFITYIDMTNENSMQLIDLRHQEDHITPMKTQLFEEFNADPANVNARIFVIIIRHRQI